MPPPTRNPEAVARAVIEKPPAAGATLTPDQQRANQIREKVKEGQEPKSIFEGMRERRQISRSKIERLNQENIGTERNEDGTKKLNPEEERRFREAQKETALIADYLEKGFDGLQMEQKTRLRRSVESMVQSTPELKVVFDGKTPTEQQVLLDEYIKNPKLMAKVLDDLELVTDPSNALIDHVTELRRGSNETISRLDSKRNEMAGVNGQRAAVDSMLEDFTDRTATGGRKGAKLEEIERITADMPVLTADLASFQDNAEELRDQIRMLEQARSFGMIRGENVDNIFTQISSNKSELRNLNGEIARLNSRIQLKTTHEQEREALVGSRAQIEEQRVQIEEELKQLLEEQTRATAELASGKQNRTVEEEDYVGHLKDLFSQSAVEYLIEEGQAAEEAERQLIDEEIEKTNDQAEKAVLKATKSRWDEDKVVEVGFWKFKKKQTMHTLKKSQIDRDVSDLVKVDGDPKELLKSILIDSGMNATEVDAKLNDPNFVENMQPKVLERLFSKKLQSGGLTEAEGRRVVESDWGANIIQGAISSNKEVAAALNSLVEQGIIDNTSTESIRRLGGKNLLWLLMLALGTAAVGTFGGLGAVGSAVSRE